MTLIGWMYEHPWMTFFILIAFSTALHGLVLVDNSVNTKEEKEKKELE